MVRVQWMFPVAVLLLGAGCGASSGGGGGSSGGSPGTSDPGNSDPGTSDPGSGTPGTPSTGPAPTWSTEFTADDGGWDARKQAAGAIAFGASDTGAQDGAAVALTFPGDPALSSGDRTSPEYATEIASKKPFHYGTYRARLRPAACGAGEEVVSGFFTYFNDGKDHDGDAAHLPDNSEIDVELLCGTPRYIALTVWTEYKDDAHFRKLSRTIDTVTGAFTQSVNDSSYDEAPAGSSADLVVPGFPASGAYYEIGFDWSPGRVRYFMSIGGKDVTLWDLQDAAHVPQLAGSLMFNVWHAPEHWFSPYGSADYPAKNAELRVDWARYWAP